MSDLRDQKAPTPVGQKREAQKAAPLTKAYREMDLLDERAIIAATSGQEFGYMIYDIPFKSKTGSKSCHKGKDCVRHGVPHTHVMGMGISGILEVCRIWGGIQVDVDTPQQTVRNGIRYWSVKAYAFDVYTGSRTVGLGECPIGAQRRGDQGEDIRGDFSVLIATSKAKRNAIRDLMPQGVMRAVIDLGKTGKTAFTQQDVERIIVPALIQRKGERSTWLQLQAGIQRPTAIAPIQAGAIPASVYMDASAASPAPEPQQQASGNGGGKPITEPQRRYLFKLLTDNGADRDAIADYMRDKKAQWDSEGIGQGEGASGLIEAMVKADFADFDKWFAERNGTADAPPAGEEGEVE